MKREVLILSQHYPPEPITRLRDLTPHLVKRGYRVSVVTTFPSYPPGRVYDSYKPMLRSQRRELGAKVTRVLALPYRGLDKGKRIASYLTFAASAFLLGLLPRALPWRRPAVVYAYHPPLTTGVAAALYSLLVRVPFVYDVQDLWPEAIVVAGFLREGSRAYRAIRLVESFIYRRAKRIIVVSEGMRGNLLRKGVPPSKIRVISNWGDPQIYHPKNVSDLRSQLGWAERFVVMSAGNMGLTHGLETVVEAAERLRADPRILFVMLGSGAAKPGLEANAQRRGLDNMIFMEQVPPQEAAQLINAADVMLVHLKEASGGDFSLPHRIFSYMLCGKPIIAAAAGSTADLVQMTECGWVSPPSDPAALAATILRAIAEPETCLKLGSNGLVAARTTYSREHLLKKIEACLEAI